MHPDNRHLGGLGYVRFSFSFVCQKSPGYCLHTYVLISHVTEALVIQ